MSSSDPQIQKIETLQGIKDRYNLHSPGTLGHWAQYAKQPDPGAKAEIAWLILQLEAKQTTLNVVAMEPCARYTALTCTETHKCPSCQARIGSEEK